MRTVLIASLKHNRRRYIASALAVVLGVAFIVITNGLAGALRTGMTKDVALPYTGAEYVIDESDRVLDMDELRAEAEKHDTAVVPQFMEWTSGKHDGRELSMIVGTFADVDAMQWQEPIEGTLPEKPGQALVGERLSVGERLEVGDTIVVPGVDGNKDRSITVVGIIADKPMVFQDFFVLPADGEALGFSSGRLLASGPVEWLDESGLGVSVRSVETQIAQDQVDITRGVDVIAMLVSVFAAIALMVAILVITNTFAILFAQRARDFALLRCVGVTRAQLRRSVRIEALVLGVVASAVGVVLGMLGAGAIAALVGTKVDLMGRASFSVSWIVAAVLIGVLVTVVAAWIPTRAVTRISPLAALRPTGGVDAKSRAGVFRIIFGLLVTAAGAFGLLVSVVLGNSGSGGTGALVIMLAAGAITFTGVLLLGPLLVPALVRLFGRLVTRPGPAGAVPRLATSNAVRNPRRTATTAASLMVGVTLTTAVLAGLSSVRVTILTEMENSAPLDAWAMPADPDADLSGAAGKKLLAAARAEESVAEAILLQGAQVELGGNAVRAVEVNEDEKVLRGEEKNRFQGADVLVDWNLYNTLTMDEDAYSAVDGETRIELVGPQGRTKVSVTGGDIYGDGTVAVRSGILSKVAQETPQALWVRVSDGAEATAVDTGLTRAGVDAGISLTTGGDYANREVFDKQFTVISGGIVGLLSVAVLIALIGIANTLGLSVLERSQEHALLRAMGYTKRQMRQTLAWEGVLLATVATVVGVTLGLLFGRVGLEVLIAAVDVPTTFSVPVWQLLVMVAVAVVAGILASVVPSRKAARVSPAEGLSLQ